MEGHSPGADTQGHAGGEDPRHGRPAAYAALNGIFILALFYTLYFTRAFFLPLILALLFTFLLRPIVRGLRRLGIPEFLGSALVIVFLIGAIGYGVFQLAEPASEWMNSIPDTTRKLQGKLHVLRRPVEKMTKAAEELKDITNMEKRKKLEVELKRPSLTDTFLAGLHEFAAKGSVMVILLYFLLASGDLFLRKLVKLFPGFHEKKQVVEIAHDLERTVSRYLLTVTLINISMGAATSLGMYLIGMPNPVLWGVMAGLLIFIPYLGPLIGIGIVAIVAFLTFDSLSRAFLAPGIYLLLETLEGQIITPIALGIRFELNPVAIFVWLIFWGWLWDIAGALIAVPLLTIFKIFCDHIPPLKAVGEFLGK